jgi:beta-glucanase (GH16 family)
MLAFWLIGFEEAAGDQSGEICVAELYGNAIGQGRSSVRAGIKAHHDPGLRDDMADVMLDVDATAWHTYTAEWTRQRVRFFVDDRPLRGVHQGVDYPLQVMIDLFEFPEGSDRDPAAYPKIGQVRAVRGYRRVART